MTIRIATWNVNSVKARLAHLCQWLGESGCEIVLLQELKCETDAFPAAEIEALGYNVAIYGQKSYNGVAILSKYPMDEVTRGLPQAATLAALSDEQAAQARYIEASISVPSGALRVASIYVPNGQEIGCDKFVFKLKFLAHLRAHAHALLAFEEPIILGGDYNVAPYAADVYDAAALDGSVCYHADERDALRSILHLGYMDAFRALHPDAAQRYSWWDYRGGGYANNKGYRIDHLLCNPLATDALQACEIDETPRGWEKPSDHAPVIATLAL
jgi:exodeoxyribonuclease III